MLTIPFNSLTLTGTTDKINKAGIKDESLLFLLFLLRMETKKLEGGPSAFQVPRQNHQGPALILLNEKGA